MSELYWIAYYDDGSTLEQFGNGQTNTYRDIERDKLTAFGLYNGSGPVVLIDFRDDTSGDPEIGPKRLIWRMRNQVSTSGQRNRIHLVGWQRKIRGRNVQSICYVTPDGKVVLGGQWTNDINMMHPIKVIEDCEQDLL